MSLRICRAVCNVYRPVGTPFKSIREVRKHLEKNTETEPLVGSEKVEVNDVLVFKLLRLSGLSPKQVDLPEIKSCLSKQIEMVNVLQSISLPEGEEFDLQKARLLPRETKPIKYAKLLQLIKEQKAQDDEVSGFWGATSLTDTSQNGYFVVNKKSKC